MKKNIKELSKLTREEAIIELNHLAKLIEKHNKLYYQDDNPLISDADYDKLIARSSDLEEYFPEIVHQNGPSKQVGSKPKKGFQKVLHKVPMLSLSNAFSIEEIQEFLERTRRFLKIIDEEDLEIFAEPKIDGLSATLIYKNGNLLIGSTRGDGKQGENITENIKYIKDIPKILKGNYPKDIEIRGEIYISNEDFERINMQRLEEGLQPFANPRNAAAGSVRNLNVEITKQRNLGFYAYNWGVLSSPIGKTLVESRRSLESFGFIITKPAKICKGIEEIKSYYDDLFKKRPTLDYDIDGAVYKLNDLGLYYRLGETEHSPRYSISHKFPPEKGATVLEEVYFQVGRTGAITPVAKLVPITIGGVRVQRATLHNKEEIFRLGIKKGDTILIERAGDVIPKISGFISNLRPSNAEEIEFPKFCPSCNQVLEGETITRCNNFNYCKSQVLGRLIHFVSRDAFNIEGLGEKQLKELFDLGIIKNFGDIFRLASNESYNVHKEISSLSGWGNLSLSNIIGSINDSRSLSLSKLIYSLGIRHVGQGASKLISQYFNNSDDFIARISDLEKNSNLKRISEDLMSINGLGKKAVESLLTYFINNFREFKDLNSFIQIEKTEKIIIDNPFFEKNIVFTGTLEKLSRSEAKNLAENVGAIISNQLSSKTDILVVGKNPGSKIKKANNLSVQIIDEKKFLLNFRRN